MKTIAFLTGTRADFGKLKSLIQAVHDSPKYSYHIFVTGMHLQEMYGKTVIEIEKANFNNISTFKNDTSENTMDLTLAKTIEGFSVFVKEVKPDLIIVHGDRVEALAGAIVGSLNNRLVGHVEGGEISGTVDELIRHSVSKLSHIHFVSHNLAARRLLQMGELAVSICTIGSPDLDILFSDNLPSVDMAKEHYEIPFQQYAIVLFHPVTTEIEKTAQHAQQFVDALLEDDSNYIVIYPNNDLGSKLILESYDRFRENASRFKIFPSIRFEFFIALLQDAQFLIGNSSAGIHEAPYAGVPAVNIGRRQENRDLTAAKTVHVSNETQDILKGIRVAKGLEIKPKKHGQSETAATLFLETLDAGHLWDIDHQKQFRDLYSGA